MENFDEGGVDASQNIDIELEGGIDNSELENFLRDNHDCTDNQQNTSHNFEESNNNGEFILSEYSGEVSRIDYLCQSAQNEECDSDNPTTVADKEHQQIREQFDLDNYMSPHPGSSSHVNLLNLDSSSQVLVAPSRDLTTGKIVTTSRENSATALRSPIIGSQLPLNSHVLDGNHSSSKQQMPRRDLSSNKNTTKNGMRPSVLTPNQTVPVSTSLTHKSAPPCTVTTAPTSKEKSLDAIRQKMDSCLSAIANKVTDKPQRSPHAPFLAYLGTKLPNVPKEKIAHVEQELLEIVRFHSK